MAKTPQKNKPPVKPKQKAKARTKATSPKGKAAEKQHAPLAAQEAALTKAAWPQFEGLGLTLKQQLFVIVYCRADMGFNGTRAYIEAYDLEGIDDYMVAATSATRLLKNAKVQRAISVELDRQLNNHDELSKRVLGEWQRQSFFDVTQFLAVSGPFVYLNSIEELPVHFRGCIKSIENTQSGVKVTFYDKQRAQENIAKCLGMFASDKVEVVDETYEGLVQRIAREEQAKHGN